MQVAKMLITAVFLLATVATVINAFEGNITVFEHPSGIVAPASIVTLNCQAIGQQVSWYINGTRKYADDSTMDYNITNTQIDGNNMHRNLTLTIVARADDNKNYNNTHVLCLATGVYSGSDDIETYDLIIAGVPLPPQLMVNVQFNATGLNITWVKPFSPEGFPIISYNLTVYNQSSNSSLLISPLHADNLTYLLTNSASYSNTCHSLDINITARNAVGDSVASATITSGFPIVPDVEDDTLQEEVSFDVHGNARIQVEFQLLAICTYQDAVNYTLYLLNETGQVVATIGPKPSLGSEHIEEEFTDGILKNKTYLVRLLVAHRDVGEMINITQRNIVVPLHLSPTNNNNNPITDNNNELLIISMASLGVAVLVCTVLAITMTSIACACRKGRRPAISEHVEVPLSSLSATTEFKLAPPPKGKAKVPTSLQSMAVNPIYAGGPTYESPSGESFRSLLGCSSVPSTPLGPTTPLGETSRYFDMPPSLPPPRKTSVSIKPQPGIPEEVEPTCNGYNNTTSTTSLVQRPADVPPAVFEAMGGGEYASIRK